MTYIDETTLPSDPVEAQAVLHVRRRLRRVLRDPDASSEDRVDALSLLFGRPEIPRSTLEKAAAGVRPIADLGEYIARETGTARLGNDREHVEQCRVWLLDEKRVTPGFNDIVAFDLGTLLALSQARELAVAGNHGDRPPVPVLVVGETGTGKELVTRAIHELSKRSGGLVPVHLAGMPKDQISDEIFGHVRGAYTGAHGNRAGRLEEAHRGTLHLDEVGDLPAEAQVRLLRVLQDGQYSRAGEDKFRSVDVRIIANTWHDLDDLVSNGRFRRDFYHRICATTIRLPPLRSRRTEFERLIAGLMTRLGSDQRLAQSALDALRCYEWPGNLREMDTALRVAISSASSGPLRLEDLPPEVQSHYLRQPLEVRAVGIILDDPDDAEVPDEILTRRIGVLDELVSADTPKPDVPPATRALLDGMTGLPDPTGEHDRALSAVRHGLSLELEATRDQRIAQRLHAIALGRLPKAVSTQLEMVADAHDRAASRILKSARAAVRDLDLNRSPWWRLYQELVAMPIFAREDRTDILNGVAFLVRFGHSFAPELLEVVGEIVKEGGVRGLLDATKTLLIDAASEGGESSGDGGLQLPATDPRTWTTEQWEAASAQASSLKELAEAVGRSEKTLRGYIREAGVQPHWARR